MASFSEKEKRDVIPNWRNYVKTAKMGEFSSVLTSSIEVPLFQLSEYEGAWKENKSVAYAGDFISAAIMNGQSLLPEVQTAARYIVEHENECTQTLYKAAKSILPIESRELINMPTDTVKKLDEIEGKEIVYKERINFLRKENRKYPYNSINYCELARCYVNLGLVDKAEKMMKIAVHLAPASRYVSRSAARMFMHSGDMDLAHHILTRNPWISKDPWLIASEIAVNSARDRGSRFVNRGIEIIKSDNYAPFSYSELASAIGTLEMKNGSKKGCRNYINKALLCPNDNSLAQAEWLQSENKDIRLTFGDYSYLHSKAEADSRLAYFKDNFQSALNSSIDWVEDFPFDKDPILFASGMAYTYLKDYDTAIRIIEIGLRANPNDTNLLNNLAYVLSLDGQTDKAEIVLQTPVLSSTSLQKNIKVCLTATKGLTEYRKGNIAKGQSLYYKAITDAKNAGCDKFLIDKAFLNFIREEVLFNSAFDRGLLNVVENLWTGNDKETTQMKQDIRTSLKTKENLLHF
jgi:tetratricopeptide (TPR) repeat protein